jgi:hypothetical protein
MLRSLGIVFSFGLLLAVACDDSSSGAGGGAGMGGNGATGGGGNGGSAGQDCQSLELECQVLDESECELLAGCFEVRGALWEGDIEDCLAKQRQFLGCKAGCLASPQVPTCIYQLADPNQCYCLTEASVPTGWEEVFECQIPLGFCGEAL